MKELLEQHYGLRVESLTPLTGGLVHQVWRAGEYVVKQYRGADWQPSRVAETLRVQQAAAGLPVPEMVVTLAGELLVPVQNGCLTVQRFAPGARLEGAQLTCAHAEEAGRRLAEVHLALGALPAEGSAFIPQTERIRQRCLDLLAKVPHEGDEFDAHTREALRYRLTALAHLPVDGAMYAEMIPQVVHGDYYPANLLWEEGRVSAILDWDFAGPGWREMEIARGAVECAASPNGGLELPRARAFVDAYAGVFPLSAGQRRHMFRLWFNHFLWSLYPLPFRYQAPDRLPAGWHALALRRHHQLVRLGLYMDELSQFCAM